MEESIGKTEIKEKGVPELIEKDSIVWFKTSNQEINCGIVLNYFGGNSVTVMNYDAWSVWGVDFDRIVRIGVSFFTDEYRNWINR